ncbi:MAG: DUF1802 family protein [Verrucomicrobia bacterium]|nr:DUF1802 family protein [Verrucomicrobiota bacterium]
MQAKRRAAVAIERFGVYPPGVRIAFKEWAIIVDVLGAGEQIIILRKGGIREDRGGFQVEHSQFLLFPTLFHQQRESVIPSAQQRFDEIAPRFPDPSQLRLDYFAEVVSWRRLESLAVAERLRGQHFWRDEVIRQRFDWGKEKNIHALAVRVCRLRKTVTLPMLPSYGGCRSWIELASDIPTEDASPVLSPESFAEKLGQFHAALDQAYVAP